MARYDELEGRVGQLIQQLAREFPDLGESLRWQVSRALIHQAIHHAVDNKEVDFCTVATYLGEMVGHAHKLAHGDNPKAPAHKDFVH